MLVTETNFNKSSVKLHKEFIMKMGGYDILLYKDRGEAEIQKRTRTMRWRGWGSKVMLSH